MASVQPRPVEVIEIFDDDLENVDPHALSQFAELQDYTTDIEEPSPVPPSSTTPIPQRNARIIPPNIGIDSQAHPSGGLITRGSAWRLYKKYHDTAPYFFVRQIIEDLSNDNVVLRGLALYPNKHAGGMLAWGGYARYHVYIKALVDRDDPRPWHTQGMIELPIEALQMRIPLKLSAQHYDRGVETQPITQLTCHRVFIESYPSAAVRSGKPRVKQLEIEFCFYLLSTQCIDELQGPVRTTRRARPQPRRQRTVRGAASSTASSEEYDYSYGSLCSGCGGDCKGAKDAGATVRFAVDKHDHANKTLRLNLPTTRVYCDDISNVSMFGQRCRICHGSFPCQPHSLAHTRPGKNDEANYHASLSCSVAIETLCPDVVTMENVPGLMQKEESRPWYVTIINQLAETGPGYNIRWKLVDFREYGLCPRRTRLVAFASRRGVPLPDFPKPTHGPNGSKPFTTVHQVMTSLSERPYLSHNEVPKHCTMFNPPRPSYDPHTKVLGCITTSGGENNVHPSGRRSFTVRELASLNMMPFDFEFPEMSGPGVQNGVIKGELIKQIGNCIPPGVWAAFIGSVLKTLRAYDNSELDADGESIAQTAPRADSAHVEVIDSDSDGEDGDQMMNENTIARDLRRMSVTVSRASSRTLSPGPSPPPRPTRRPRFTADSFAAGEIVDLTQEERSSHE